MSGEDRAESGRREVDTGARMIELDRQLGGKDRPEVLARTFEDSTISDIVTRGFGGSYAGKTIWITMTATQSRLESVLGATANLAVPGLQTGGAIKGWEDSGFRAEYKDPHPSSNNQLGHFLTAVALGYNPRSVRNGLAQTMRRSSGILGAVGEMMQREPMLRKLNIANLVDPFGRHDSEQVALRLIIGHEKVADPIDDPSVFLQQFAAATDGDVACFRSAEQSLGKSLPLDTARAGAVLHGISVNNRQRGNSYEDLLLSLVGWRFGRDILARRIGDAVAAAGWLRSTLK